MVENMEHMEHEMETGIIPGSKGKKVCGVKFLFGFWCEKWTGGGPEITIPTYMSSDIEKGLGYVLV